MMYKCDIIRRQSSVALTLVRNPTVFTFERSLFIFTFSSHLSWLPVSCRGMSPTMRGRTSTFKSKPSHQGLSRTFFPSNCTSVAALRVSNASEMWNEKSKSLEILFYDSPDFISRVRNVPKVVGTLVRYYMSRTKPFC